jgi:hypothetical protein
MIFLNWCCRDVGLNFNSEAVLILILRCTETWMILLDWCCRDVDLNINTDNCASLVAPFHV